MLALAECAECFSSPEERLAVVATALALGLPAAAVIEAHALLAELHSLIGDSSAAKSSADSAVDFAGSFRSSYLLGQAWLAQVKQVNYDSVQSHVVLNHLSAALDCFKRADSAVGYKLFANVADDCSARLRTMSQQIRELAGTLQAR